MSTSPLRKKSSPGVSQLGDEKEGILLSGAVPVPFTCWASLRPESPREEDGVASTEGVALSSGKPAVALEYILLAPESGVVLSVESEPSPHTMETQGVPRMPALYHASSTSTLT